jgi:recombination protein RecA
LKDAFLTKEFKMANRDDDDSGGKKVKGSVIVSAAALIKKRFGRDISISGEKYAKVPNAISTGSILLNNALGECKGYPFGSVIEVFGWEGAGKTLMLYLAIAEAQRKYPDRPCVLIDAERQFQFQAKWATKVGVDVSKLIVIPVSTAEEAFDIIHALVLGEHEVDKKSGEVIKVINPGKYAIIGVDSVTQLVSLTDATKDMGESRQRGSQATAIGLGLKKVTSAMARYDVDSHTILYFINQLRKNPNKMFGNPEYRTGGNALPFYNTIAFKVAKVYQSEERDENGEIISHGVKITFEKNKAGSMPEEAVCFTLMHDGSGVNNETELFDVALMNGLLKEIEEEKNGKIRLRYNIFDPSTDERMFSDIKDFAKRGFNTLLENRPEIKEQIMKLIEDRKIFKNKDEVKEYVPDSAYDESGEDNDVDDIEQNDKSTNLKKSTHEIDDEQAFTDKDLNDTEKKKGKRSLKLR